MILDMDRKQFPTWRACIVKTYQEGGIARLYRGLGHALIRASPVAATVLPVYEITRNKLFTLFESARY
jgi:hypothetical protein